MPIHDEIYNQLLPELEKLESHRVSTKKKKSKAITFCILIGLVTLILGVAFASGGGSALRFPITVAVGALISSIVYKQIAGNAVSAYYSSFKTQIIGRIAKILEPDVVYSPNAGITRSHFQSIGHYKKGIDRYRSEDQFHGTIGQTEILFSELHAEYKTTSTDSEGRTTTHWHTIFKGVMFSADFHKHFQTWLMIRPDKESGLFGWIGKKMQGMNSTIIRLESPEFEEHFKVSTGDEQQARYILTPDMQERLLKLRKSHGKDIIVSFQKESVYITAPNNRDWFETHLNTPALSKDQVTRLISQMNYYFSIVKTLNLNTRIWTKE